MKASIKYLALAVATLSPSLAFAQMNDADYCKALTQKYETYLANPTSRGSPQPDSIDGRVAVDQCKAGKPAAGIPVLEKKLQNAKIDLPPRG